MLFFQPIMLCSIFFTNLPIMLPDVPIMLRGFTHYAQFYNENCAFNMTKYTAESIILGHYRWWFKQNVNFEEPVDLL